MGNRMQTLSYPIAIRCKRNKQIINTLFFFRKVINFYLRQFFNKISIEKLDEKKYAYKCLEKIAIQRRYYIPSRINRGLLEIAGRILRSIKDRRELYSLLLELSNDPGEWDYKRLIKKEIYKKSQYVENLKEQALNYIKENETLPSDYLDLISPPNLKRGMISFAPDDGQAIRMKVELDLVEISLKVLKENKDESLSQTDWEWIEISFPLPDIVSEIEKYKKPSLRLSFIGGKLTPVLDFKVELKEEDRKESKNFLTVDWGLNKLVTVCVFNSKGEQISRPFFLKCDVIQRKLLRIRAEIDNLKAKRDKSPYGSTLYKFYNKKIAKKWNKFRGIQKQLSHLASNVIVEIANLYNCSKVYVEWLGSLKSKRVNRELNWKINSQVRQKIFDLLEYKAKLCGISLKKPINPAWTSQYCPKCGKRGLNVKSSDRLDEKINSGGWFYCPSCGYNADRDYVACQNIARKVLFGKKLKGMGKAFVYKANAIPDRLFRQGISAIWRLRHNLNGWKNSVFLRPVVIYAGTLRL
ncbi:MAG: zinc ribbon domain-containing protein [Candidatus Poribacteria bacterium]